MDEGEKKKSGDDNLVRTNNGYTNRPTSKPIGSILNWFFKFGFGVWFWKISWFGPVTVTESEDNFVR